MHSTGGLDAQRAINTNSTPIEVKKEENSGSKRLIVDSSDKNGIAFIQLKKSEDFLEKIKYSTQKTVLPFSGKYVNTEIETTYRDQTEQMKGAINVNSLSEHLGISKKDVKRLGKVGKLGEVLQTVHKGTEASQEVHEFLGAGKGDRVNAKELMTLFAENTLQRISEINSGNSILQIQGTVISNGRKEIGKGTFGTAYKVQELSPKSLILSTFAEKVSKIDLDQPQLQIEARKDLENEAVKLREITDLAKLRGREDVLEAIQEAPFSLTFEGPTGTEIGVMRNKLYLGNVKEKCSQLTITQKIKGMSPLFSVLSFIQSEHLVHVDIKPANIFIDTNSLGNTIFRLADFGGTRWECDLAKFPKDQIVMTPDYTPHPKRDGIDTHDAASLQRVATFQMGVTFFYILSDGKFPYPHIKQFLDTKGKFNEDALAGFPVEIIDFIKAVVHPDPTLRPIGEKIYNEWQNIILSCGSIDKLAEQTEATVLSSRVVEI